MAFDAEEAQRSGHGYNWNTDYLAVIDTSGKHVVEITYPLVASDTLHRDTQVEELRRYAAQQDDWIFREEGWQSYYRNLTYTDGEVRIFPDYNDHVLYKYEAERLNSYLDVCLDKYGSDLFVGNEETFVLRNFSNTNTVAKRARDEAAIENLNLAADSGDATKTLERPADRWTHVAVVYDTVGPVVVSDSFSLSMMELASGLGCAADTRDTDGPDTLGGAGLARAPCS